MIRIASRIASVLQIERTILRAFAALALKEAFALLRAHIINKAFLRLEVKAHLLAVVFLIALRVHGLALYSPYRVLDAVSMHQRTVGIHFNPGRLQFHILIFHIGIAVQISPTRLRIIGNRIRSRILHRSIKGVLLLFGGIVFQTVGLGRLAYLNNRVMPLRLLFGHSGVPGSR